MKNFVTKGLSVITIISMAFISNIAMAVTIETPVIEVCQEQVLVSTPGENGDVEVNPHHSAWTASISGAEWVWSENPIADPVGETTEIFSRTFTVTGTPVDGSLEMAADNEYKVSLNGNLPFVVDANEDNYSNAGQDSLVIPASEFITGENTIEFEVKNWAQEGGTMESNPAGLMYKLTIPCGEEDEEDEEPICIEGNLIENGGFESPTATEGGWDIYDSGTSGLAWDVEWNGSFTGAPETAKLEIHNGVGGWLPYEDSQYAELDTDWGINDGEEASVIISQDIDTVPGVTYEVSYAFSARPNTGAGENILELLVDGSPVQTKGPMVGSTNTVWNTDTYSFVASDESTTIAFRDSGTPNSIGTFIDDVSVSCDEEVCLIDCEPVCEVDCEPTCDEEECPEPTCEETGTCPIDEPSCEETQTCPPTEPTCEETQTCETGDDDGDDTGDDDSSDNSSGGGSSSGSRRSSGGGSGGGEVLGAETSMCTWDVNTYMRKGYKNDPTQVMILQRDLLNGYMNAGVVVDGIYGPSTEAAVKAFQLAKGDKIIKPWYNLFQPTGIFYKTTLVEAKNTICPDEILPIPTDLIDWSQNPAEVPAKI